MKSLKNLFAALAAALVITTVGCGGANGGVNPPPAKRWTVENGSATSPEGVKYDTLYTFIGEFSKSDSTLLLVTKNTEWELSSKPTSGFRPLNPALAKKVALPAGGGPPGFRVSFKVNGHVLVPQQTPPTSELPKPGGSATFDLWDMTSQGFVRLSQDTGIGVNTLESWLITQKLAPSEAARDMADAIYTISEVSSP